MVNSPTAFQYLALTEPPPWILVETARSLAGIPFAGVVSEAGGEDVRLLSGVMRQIATRSESQSALDLQKEILKGLKGHSEKNVTAGWQLVYVGLSLVREQLLVCTLGDLRATLSRNSTQLTTSKEHILRNEPREWIAEVYGEIDIEQHGSILTRTVFSPRAIADFYEWTAEVGDVVTISSTDPAVHVELVVT